ncbi:MAG: TAXI family TRAP transporter solute-binding subunit, partial [Geminicoccaceae bacterium]
DITTMAHSTLLVANADLSAELVYLITKSIFENLAYLHRVDPALSSLTMDQALFGMSLPLHPGALRYFKETGFIPEAFDLQTPGDDDEPSNHDAMGYPNADVAIKGGTTLEGPLALDTAFGKAVVLDQRLTPNAESPATSMPQDEAS